MCPVLWEALLLRKPLPTLHNTGTEAGQRTEEPKDIQESGQKMTVKKREVRVVQRMEVGGGSRSCNLPSNHLQDADPPGQS